jgi:TonB family protein
MLVTLAALAMPAILVGQAGADGAALVTPPVPPRLVKTVAPEYPDRARDAGIGGPVTLECEVDTQGRMALVRAIGGPPPLRQAAETAVRKWRYKPLLLKGVATRFVLTVTVNFRHDGRVSIGRLIECLEDKDEYIREGAAISLGLLGAQAVRAQPALMRAANDQSERVRQAAELALDQVRGKSH